MEALKKINQKNQKLKKMNLIKKKIVFNLINLSSIIKKYENIQFASL